jgi:hypothetical protein
MAARSWDDRAAGTRSVAQVGEQRRGYSPNVRRAERLQPGSAAAIIALHQLGRRQAALLAPLAAHGKALMRGRLWDASTQIERSAFPTLGRIMAGQTHAMPEREAEDLVQQRYRNDLY